MGKYEESVGINMTKSRILTIGLVIIIIILAVIYFTTTKKQQSQKSPYEPVAISNQTAVAEPNNLTKVLGDSGIEKWGFGATKDGICYLAEDFSLKFFTNTDQKTQTVFRPTDVIEAAKIVSTSETCIVEYFTPEKNLLYLYSPNQAIKTLDYVPTGSISSNQNLYVIMTATGQLILNSDGTTALTINDAEGNNMFVAPTSTQNYFLVGPYNGEDYSGKLRLVENNTVKFSQDIISAAGLAANSTAALSASQNENQIYGNLIDTSGQLKAKIVDIDPSTLTATNDGFYFLTHPGGIATERASQNGIGFISNTGEVKNVISSKDESVEQYNFSAISFVDNTLYASNGDLIYKIAI